MFQSGRCWKVSCSIARALLGLQQISMAAPAPLTGPVHLQIESLGSLPGKTLAPVLQAWLGLHGRSLLLVSFYRRLFLETFNFLPLSLLAGCDRPRAAHTLSQMQQILGRRGLLAREEHGLSIFASSLMSFLLLQEKAATNTDTCADFPVRLKPLNLSHVLQIPQRAEQLSASGTAGIISPVSLTSSSHGSHQCKNIQPF